MYHFEPASYKLPEGFLPAIGCYKKDKKGVDVFKFVLVNRNLVHKTEDRAVKSSTESLRTAFKLREDSGDDKKVGESLSLEGYKIVDDPLFAK